MKYSCWYLPKVFSLHLLLFEYKVLINFDRKTLLLKKIIQWDTKHNVHLTVFKKTFNSIEKCTHGVSVDFPTPEGPG